MRDAEALESGKGQTSSRRRANGKCPVLHPTTLLFIWFSFVLAGQSLVAWHILLTLLLLAVFGESVRQDWKRLAWSTRWLIVSLFVVFAWGEAGEPAWQGALAPTREGLATAMTHVARLLLVLMAVAVLRRWMPLPDLLRGLHRLLQPFRRCRVDSDRFLVRLLLVLRQVDQMPANLRDWRSLLTQQERVGGHAGGEVIELADSPLSCLDYLAILLACGLLVALCLQRM